MNNNWTQPLISKNNIFDRINVFVDNFVKRYQDNVPNFENTKNLMCFSDYSGEETNANFYLYSFILIDGDRIGEWNKIRTNLRQRILPDGRRISFKNYRDKLGQKYINEYLKLADNLSGYLFLFAFDKKIESIFQKDTPINLKNPQFQKYQNWTKDTLEKTFRIIHLIRVIMHFSDQVLNSLGYA